jgi:hypothetical protein
LFLTIIKRADDVYYTFIEERKKQPRRQTEQHIYISTSSLSSSDESELADEVHYKYIEKRQPRQTKHQAYRNARNHSRVSSSDVGQGRFNLVDDGLFENRQPIRQKGLRKYRSVQNLSSEVDEQSCEPVDEVYYRLVEKRQPRRADQQLYRNVQTPSLTSESDEPQPVKLVDNAFLEKPQLKPHKYIQTNRNPQKQNSKNSDSKVVEQPNKGADFALVGTKKWAWALPHKKKPAVTNKPSLKKKPFVKQGKNPVKQESTLVDTRDVVHTSLASSGWDSTTAQPKPDIHISYNPTQT